MSGPRVGFPPVIPSRSSAFFFERLPQELVSFFYRGETALGGGKAGVRYINAIETDRIGMTEAVNYTGIPPKSMYVHQEISRWRSDWPSPSCRGKIDTESQYICTCTFCSDASLFASCPYPERKEGAQCTFSRSPHLGPIKEMLIGANIENIVFAHGVCENDH